MFKAINIRVDENAQIPEKDYLAFRRELARHCGRSITYEIKRYHKPRSNQQNRAVMGFWLGIIMADQGYHEHEKDALYEAIKAECWGEEIVSKKTGQVIRKGRLTRNLDAAEYSKFMDAFRAYVFDFFGIYLPDPIKSLAYI